MSDTISNALLLMAVGMVTVFVILSIVVFAGRILINIVNRFAKEAEQKSSIPVEHIAVISAVTAQVSQGHAHEIKIEKI